ncbi:MAG: hypothetical protein H6652_24110 [Ardenticatenaceae bacterium]|nr:hypothetical protein [Ardenticatenaceae bacterium]
MMLCWYTIHPSTAEISRGLHCSDGATVGQTVKGKIYRIVYRGMEEWVGERPFLIQPPSFSRSLA